MIGNMVYTTWPVPQRTVRNQVVTGARTVMCFGLLRRNFSAYFSMTVSPPDVCRKPAQVTTARMVSMTPIGGVPGL